jgi:hypothetical protein
MQSFYGRGFSHELRERLEGYRLDTGVLDGSEGWVCFILRSTCGSVRLNELMTSYTKRRAGFFSSNANDTIQS